MEQINAVGRRKAAIARVYVKEGTGEITVNKRPLADYFPNPILQYIVKQPLSTLEVAEKYDIKVNLVGGGYKAAQGGFHDPRPACCRAQETRSAQGPQEIPVQQALIAA